MRVLPDPDGGSNPPGRSDANGCTSRARRIFCRQVRGRAQAKNFAAAARGTTPALSSSGPSTACAKDGQSAFQRCLRSDGTSVDPALDLGRIECTVRRADRMDLRWNLWNWIGKASCGQDCRSLKIRRHARRGRCDLVETLDLTCLGAGAGPTPFPLVTLVRP